MVYIDKLENSHINESTYVLSTTCVASNIKSASLSLYYHPMVLYSWLCQLYHFTVYMYMATW